jgi:hypothetical protein
MTSVAEGAAGGVLASPFVGAAGVRVAGMSGAAFGGFAGGVMAGRALDAAQATRGNAVSKSAKGCSEGRCFDMGPYLHPNALQLQEAGAKTQVKRYSVAPSS